MDNTVKRPRKLDRLQSTPSPRKNNTRCAVAMAALYLTILVTSTTRGANAESPSSSTLTLAVNNSSATNATDVQRAPSSAPWTDTSGPRVSAQDLVRGAGAVGDFRYDVRLASTRLPPAVVGGPAARSAVEQSSTVDGKRVAGQWELALAKVKERLFGGDLTTSGDTLCHRHTDFVLREALKLEPWALQMMDASAKIPSGVLQGNTDWWGSYAECVEVHVSGLNRTTRPKAIGANDDHFDGQYCTVSVNVDSIKIRNTNSTETLLVRLGLLEEISGAGAGGAISVSLGLCVPSTCSALDTQTTVQAIMDSMQLPVIVSTQSCQSKSTYKLDTPAYAVICVWSVFTLLIVLGTAYETAKYLLSNCRCCDKPKTSSGHHSAGSLDPLAAHSTETLSKHGKVGKFLLCFSAISNVKQIMNVGQTQAEHMSTLHGIRFLSMSWIILGHTYFVGMISRPLWDNSKDFLALPANFAFQGVLRGIFSVDTFLFLSGLLVVYVTMKKMKATDGKFNIFSFYLHRIIRIVPVYLMAIAWVAGPSDYVLAGGPMWPQMVTAKKNCQETWWKNLLFISNFGDTTKMCIQHSWYISLDTQLYVISPLLLYPMYRYPRLGVLLTVLCIVASCTTAGIISYTLGLPSSSLLHTVPVDALIAYAKEFYIKPYCRMGPYAVGMLFGYLLLNADLKTRIKPPLTYLLWLLAIASNLSILYGTYGQFITETAPSVLQSAIYNALSGTVWTMGIGWLVCACVVGHGGIVNSILSWKVWVPLSRLTYCAYLLHMIVQYTFFDSRQNKFHFDHLLMVTLFAGFMLVTYGASLIFSVAFEAPIIRLEKLAMSGGEKKITKNGSTNL